MKTKRFLAVLLAALMVTGLLAGCGGNNSSSTTTTTAAATTAATTAAPAETQAPESGEAQTEAPAEAPAVDVAKYQVTAPVEIEFWFQGGKLQDYFAEVVEEFNASQEYITVVPRYINGGYAKVREQLTAAQTAGTGLPGVATINFPSLPAFGMSDAAEDLTEYLAAFDVDTSDFIQGYMDAVTIDGVVRGLPMGPSAQVYYYNKDVVDELGLTFPTTWDEYKAYVQAVYEKTGKAAMIYESDQNTYYNMALNFGGAMIEDDGVTSGYGREALITRMKEMRDLVKAGYVEWSIEGGASNVENRFLTGDVMGLAKTCADLKNLVNEDFEVGTAWNFKDVSAYSTIGGMVLMIPTSAPQEVKNAGFQFAVWMTSAEQNEPWCSASSYALTHYSSIAKGDGEGTPIAEISKTLPGIEVVYEHSDDIISKSKSLHYDSVMVVYQACIDQLMSDLSADFDSTWSAMVDECNYILAGN